MYRLPRLLVSPFWITQGFQLAHTIYFILPAGQEVLSEFR